MGIFRDLGERLGVVPPSNLDDVGSTGILCLDRWIDEGAKLDMEREEARRKLERK